MIGAGLLGKKLGMTHVYDSTGKAVAVTAVDVSDNEIIRLKKKESDGYSAVQVGCFNKKESRVNKPEAGHFKKNGKSPKYFVREFRLEDDSNLPAPDAAWGVNVFEEGQWVDVIGVTKGRGFAGAVKRYRFSGQRQTHGQMMHRRTGAIGCRLTPGRVWKNQRMPGHMGVDNVTTQNLKVVARREADNVLLISGSIPGPKGGYLIIRPAKKKGTHEEEVKREAERKKAIEKAQPKSKK
jgi:large subunit ribosomal protein L3